MPINLRVLMIAFAIFMILIIIYILRKGRISIKYSLVWFFSGGILLISVLIPNFVEKIATFLGFELMSNMIFTILIGILLFITISLTIIVSGQNNKIRLLIQEISMLKGNKKK